MNKYLLMGALLLGACSNTPAEDIVDDFPTEIPGARSVIPYEVDGAKYVLAHVKLLHSAAKGKLGPAQAAILDAEVEKVGKDIEKTLGFLTDEYSLTGYYPEGGFTDEGVEERLAYSDRINPGVVELVANGKRGVSRIWFGINQPTLQYQFPSEVRADRQNEDWVEQREDRLLELITARDDPLAVTIYGGGHEWKNNVDAWNTIHPDAKVALIEIFPSHFDLEKYKSLTDELVASSNQDRN